ncbi:MAG: transposase [Candidatus Omnitrophica bacterium]|nr:transposase [Candidatus Omnitrophota bacterium]
MPNAPRLLIENACYHLMVRGNQKQKVFLCDDDLQEYLERLRGYKKKFNFKLYGYCLMPTHVHIVGQIVVSRDLSKFMQALNRSYTAYFNDKYEKVGHLWQGRYRNKVIVKDQYLIDCISYVELNPIRAELVNSVCEYPWSSYRQRVLDDDSTILDKIAL